jgi:hypothetical protein
VIQEAVRPMTFQKRIDLGTQRGVVPTSTIEIRFALGGRRLVQSLEENVANRRSVGMVVSAHTSRLYWLMRVGRAFPANITIICRRIRSTPDLVPQPGSGKSPEAFHIAQR